MKKPIFLTILFLVLSLVSFSQSSKGRNVALKKTNPDEYNKKMENLKNSPSNKTTNAESIEKTIDTSVKISAFEKSSRRERKKMPTDQNTTTSRANNIKQNDSGRISPSISNSSAIANGVSSSSSAPVAKVLKYKADEKQVEYYKNLREKFAEEEKIRLEKEAKENTEKAKKEEEARQARHLNPEQAPQFDKYRNGAKNEPVVKKTPEEEYNSLFK